jgi:hypothetical protein
VALTIEDGTGILSATSYVTLAEARTFASARGASLPVTDPDLEVLLIKSMDFIEAYRDSFKGSKTYGTDGAGPYLQWPRTYVVIDGVELSTTAIPEELKKLQCQLAIELMTNDPMGTQSGQVIKRERVDVMETEYAVNTRGSTDRIPRPYMPKVEALLRPLVRTTGLTVSRA